LKLKKTVSYDRVKHIVEVDERILAVFTLDSTEQIQDLFIIAKDANIDRSMVETVKSMLDLKLESEIENLSLGKHFWDISEYERFSVIRIYEANRLIVVIAKSHFAAGDVAETVLGYLYESDKEPEPVSLF
jgi:hypothetical protein